MHSRQKRVRAFWHAFVPISWTYLRNGYSLATFRADLIAGVTVGVVALPLAMAFAIAAGLSPVAGIYTSIIAGFIISLLGGSAFQISGPTGAFVVIISSTVAGLGYEGLVIATLLAGLILIAAAFCQLGGLIKFIPYPLVIGFTTGIALIIFSTQIKDFLGLQVDRVPSQFIPKMGVLIAALPSWHCMTTLVALGTLGLILLIRSYAPILPWGITSIVVATACTWSLQLPVETIDTRYGEIPAMLASFSFPGFHILFSKWYMVVQSAIAIAFLAGIESLLSAVVADGMTGHRHKSNGELLAQGIGNIGSVLFGGIPATGAIARTAMNIKAGAKTPVAGMIHSLTLLLILLIGAPLVSQIPLAAIAAVLVMVAWNMSELHHFRHLFRAPAGDVAVLMTTFLLTVFVDLIVAIEVGMLLAAFLFMKRIRDLSGVHAMQVLSEEKVEEKPDPDAIERKHVPPGVSVYEVTGLFFFGLADSLKTVIQNLDFSPQVFILRLRKIPVIDASGMHALRDFYEQCAKKRTILILSGIQPNVHKALQKFGLIDLIGENNVFSHIDPSLERAAAIISKQI